MALIGLLLLFLLFYEPEILSSIIKLFVEFIEGFVDLFVYDKERDGKAEYSQNKLMDAYNLGDRKTIIRWLEHLTNPFVLHCYLESGKKVNGFLKIAIFHYWGNPAEGKTKGKETFMSIFYKDVKEPNETHYRKLRETILKELTELKGIYNKIDYFPPLVANKILAVI